MQLVMRRGLQSLTLALVLGLALLDPGSGVAAQDEPRPTPSPQTDRQPSYQRGHPAGALRLTGAPPAVGDPIVEDALTSPGAIPGPYSCVSGRNLSEFVGEGYIVKVTGRCRPESQSAGSVIPPIPDLDVPDGEIRIEARSVSGHDRVGLWLLFRSTSDPAAGYQLDVHPAQGMALLAKAPPGVSDIVPLAQRTDLARWTSHDDWSTYAIRLDGPDIWVLLNGEPILSAADSAFDRGWISFGVHRLGSVDDDTESAVVFRNLRVSRLAK